VESDAVGRLVNVVSLTLSLLMAKMLSLLMAKMLSLSVVGTVRTVSVWA
jgi:hypothetical protein